MKILIVFVLIFFTTFSAKSQSADDSVKAVINILFTSMKNGDSALLKACFLDSAILQTIIQKNDGRTLIQNESVSEFASFIKTAKQGDLDERIVFDLVKSDHELAIAWTPYSFYYKGNFSHCGVNSFQLVRINNEWKIQYLIDTRRKTGCK